MLELEAYIEQLEGEISQLEEDIASPEIAADYVKMSEVCKALEDKKNELGECMERWAEME